MAYTYALRVPLTLPSGQSISGLDEPFALPLGDLVGRLEKVPPRYVLTVGGFESEERARQYLERLWVALAWVCVSCGAAIDASLDLGGVEYADDPVQTGKNLARIFGPGLSDPVDGLADGNLPVVYREGLAMRYVAANPVSVSASNSPERIADHLVEGLAVGGEGAAASDDRLKTALELFRSHFAERSGNAQLLTLVMVLEVLSERREKHPVAKSLLDAWAAELESAKALHEPSSAEHADLDALGRELVFRREASLTSSIRALVVDTLTEDGHPDPVSVGKDAAKVYGARSTLAHKGRLTQQQLGDALSQARRVVDLVLKARLKQAGKLISAIGPMHARLGQLGGGCGLAGVQAGNLRREGGPMVEFTDDDHGYFSWLAQHPQGFVLNCYRKPTPSYLMLHRATCYHIQRWEGRTLTCGGYRKVCSIAEVDLRNWAARVGGVPRWCHDCAG